MTIFFVLSGFVIAHRYMDSVPFSATSFKKFLIDRIARICPLYYIITIGTFTYLIFFKESTAFNAPPIFILFTNLTFTKSFFSDVVSSLVAQGWTLTVEWCFYVCAPLMILLVKRSYKYVFFISIFLLLIGFLLIKYAQYADLGHGFFSNNKLMLLQTFFGRSFDFLCGISLAIFLRRSSNYKSSSIPWYTCISWIIILSFVFFVTIFVPKQYISSSIWNIYFSLHGILLPICVMFFLYGLIIEKTIFSQFLSSKIMVLLGSSSYAFYLLHLGVVSNFFIKMKITQNNFILHLIVINIVAIVVYKYVEKPLYNKVKKIGEKLFIRPQKIVAYANE